MSLLPVTVSRYVSWVNDQGSMMIVRISGNNDTAYLFILPVRHLVPVRQHRNCCLNPVSIDRDLKSSTTTTHLYIVQRRERRSHSIHHQKEQYVA